MLKFRGSEGAEIYLSDVGCLVIKQHSFEFGEDVMVVLTPEQAWHVKQLIDDFHEEMVNAWNEGLIQEDDNE
jgi:hypothetical protein